MEVDILKPDTGALVIERPLQSSSKGTSSRAGTSGQTTPERIQYAEPVSEGEEDEAMDMAPGELSHCSIMVVVIFVLDANG